MSNIAEITQAQRKAWKGEWPFTIELLPLNRIFADERYQRPVLEPFVANTIVAKFDPMLVGTIDVSKRQHVSEYAVLDGRQRVEGMMRVGKTSCWCTVYDHMTLSDESEFFMKKNREKRNMHPFYALRARAVSGEPDAKAIFRITEKNGFEIGIGRDLLQSVGALEDVLNMFAPFRMPGETLDKALHTIQAAWPNRKGATSGVIIKAMGRFWQSYTDDDVDWDELISKLDEMSPLQITGLAEERRHLSRNRMPYLAATEIVKWYNAKTPRNAKLSLQLLQGKAK